MEQSLFIEWVNKWFPGITTRVVQELNDAKNELTYLHRALLRKQFSATGKWESISVANTAIMADVVAMDSELPLKKRDSISKANGDIPKFGMELKMNEQQLTNLDVTIAQNATESQIISAIFNDTPKVITGIWERNEQVFLQGLSTGVALVDSDNVGTGIRIDYGYKADNKFVASVLWSSASTAKPIDEIENVFTKASLDGNVLGTIYMDKTAFNNMTKATSFKEMFAFNAGFSGGSIPSPSIEQARQVILSRFGVNLQIIDRAVRYEKNGVQTTFKPWQDGMVVFTPAGPIGSLFYAKLAEQNHPTAGVTYSVTDDFILVSKFRTNRPSLSEFTTSQARVIPVISNVEGIYTLDSKSIG
nr:MULTISPECIES: major capsid protein [unclassified Arcicella]